MLNLVPQSDCAQAREAASARLDGELPELAAAPAAVVLAAIAGSSFALGRAFNGHGAATRTVTGAAYLGVHADANHERLLAQLRAFQQVPVGQRGRVMTI